MRPGFDPAQFLFSDLAVSNYDSSFHSLKKPTLSFPQSNYKDTFKIFYDPYGGDRFGAVWDPTLKEPRPFRVLGGFSSIPKRKVSNKTLRLCYIGFHLFCYLG